MGANWGLALNARGDPSMGTTTEGRFNAINASNKMQKREGRFIFLSKCLDAKERKRHSFRASTFTHIIKH